MQEGPVPAVILVYFANSLDSFPPVKRVGDIVRLHRVKVWHDFIIGLLACERVI
jgi:hypothetical protein